MTDDPNRVATSRLLLQAADVADRQGFAFAGIIRQAAHLLLEQPEPHADRCAGCGAELEQPPNGGRKKWCRDACRTRARRR